MNEQLADKLLAQLLKPKSNIDPDDYQGEFAYTLEDICEILNIAGTNPAAFKGDPRYLTTPKQRCLATLNHMQMNGAVMVDSDGCTLNPKAKRYIHMDNYVGHMNLSGKKEPVKKFTLTSTSTDLVDVNRDIKADRVAQLDNSIFGEM